VTSSGKDASRPRGRPNPVRVDDYGRSGSPSRPDKLTPVYGETVVKTGPGATRTTSQMNDEYSRSGVMTSASTRHDHYRGPGRSWASGGPPPQSGPKKPRSYDPGSESTT
jgi:hypothetical protein